MISEIIADSLTAEEIKMGHEKKDYRPTVIACLRDESARFLIVTSKHGSDFFPQGGIKESERLTQAVKREIREEVGITDLRTIRYLFSEVIDYLPNRTPRDGFTYGKRYFVCSTSVVGEPSLVIDAAELTTARWAALFDLPEVTKTMDKEKALLVVKTLKKLGYRIDPSDFHKELGSVYL